jgi:tripartite-type tricarboxylate transporter receptor subunit TctC
MIKLNRYVFIFFLVTYLSFSILTNQLYAAETYPQKPIEVIVPYPPGGPTDLGIRAITDQLSKILKTPVLVINNPAGSGIVGTNDVVKAKKDGYTLLGTSSTPIVSLPITQSKEVPYNAIQDLEPLAHCLSILVDLVVRGDHPFNKFEDFEKYVKANPGKLNMGVPGAAIQPFFIFHILKERGLGMNILVSKGVPQGISYLLGGHTDALLSAVSTDAKYIREGKMKALAFFSNNRIPDFPNVPTIGEVGYPEAALIYWIGFFAPRGTPPEILDVLGKAFKEATTAPEAVEKAKKLMFVVEYKPGHELKTIIEAQQKIIREIAIKTKIVE